MPSRFQQLRQAVANLAAPAEEQVRYLDRLFASMTGGGSAEAYGNDELVEEFDDIFPAANDMIEYGELTEAEKEAVGPLEATLTRWCAQRDAEFWSRDALFHDPGGRTSAPVRFEPWLSYRTRSERSAAFIDCPLSTHCGH